MPATSSRACSTADPGTTVRMMRRRLPRPRTIKSASPVGSWRTWSWSTRARARMVTVWRPVSSWSSTCQAPSATRSVPARAASSAGCGVRNSRMQLAAASSRARSSSLPSATPGLASEDDTGAGGQGGWGSTPPGAATAPRRPPAAHVRPISSTARAPVTPPAAAKRPRDTQPARTTQAPATQPATAGEATRSR
jgi:hypothetical protein